MLAAMAKIISDELNQPLSAANILVVAGAMMNERSEKELNELLKKFVEEDTPKVEKEHQELFKKHGSIEARMERGDFPKG